MVQAVTLEALQFEIVSRSEILQFADASLTLGRPHDF
jgi:hypothetical protein